MTLTALAEQIRACRSCEPTLARCGVVPRPIFGGGEGFPILLVGQAPGKTEYERNAPFQGGAGGSIRSLFLACGVRDFDRAVYQTSVTKCFPGRLPGSSTDRVPSSIEVKNCLPFLKRQIALLAPKLIVSLGGLSWRAYVSMREEEEPGYCKRTFDKPRPSQLRVPDLVGKRFTWKHLVFLPMIHPAGSANGSRAQYPVEDAESKRLLREELQRL